MRKKELRWNFLSNLMIFVEDFRWSQIFYSWILIMFTLKLTKRLQPSENSFKKMKFHSKIRVNRASLDSNVEFPWNFFRVWQFIISWLSKFEQPAAIVDFQPEIYSIHLLTILIFIETNNYCYMIGKCCRYWLKKITNCCRDSKLKNVDVEYVN